MASLNRLQDPSLQFLLWLEWMLLGLTAMGEFIQPMDSMAARSLLLPLACIVLLGLRGLGLPQANLAAKLWDATLNVFLVLLASVVGDVQFFFLLCVVLMIRSGLVFKRQGRWLTMAMLFAVFILVQGYRIHSPGGLPVIGSLQAVPADAVRPLVLGSVLMYVLVLIFVQLLMNALLAERSSRERLAEANAQLRLYAFQVETVATLQERTRIAREIHDSIGHSLTALTLNLRAALGLWEQEPQEARQLLNEAQALSQAALQEARQSVATLRANPLQGKALDALIQGLIAKLQRATGIQPYSAIQIAQPLPEAQKLAAYRIVQEALTNIAKYSQATAVQLMVQGSSECLAIAIHDDGQGFDPEQTPSGFGLRGMQGRVSALEGTLDLETAPGQGCHIIAQLPLHQC